MTKLTLILTLNDPNNAYERNLLTKMHGPPGVTQSLVLAICAKYSAFSELVEGNSILKNVAFPNKAISW